MNFFQQAKEEYRAMKYRKETQWAVSVIQRHYIQWKVVLTCGHIINKKMRIYVLFHFIAETVFTYTFVTAAAK